MPKVWEILPQKSTDLIEQLLLNRNLITEQQRQLFLNPTINDYRQDMQLKGIKRALDRIYKAIKKKELIFVYGDYDVDGIASCTILYKALVSLGATVLPYIPHREKEGYGISKIGIDYAKEKGAGLIITVDNGIVALEQAKYAKEVKLDLIITDHHLPLLSLPDCYEIIHSTLMCGAGVAWCLVQSEIDQKLRDELLQFVALATITDLIPLQGISRAFVVEGLKILKQTDNIGIIALCRESGILPSNIGTFEIGHILGPRLNAVGRIDHAIEALRLLCTKDPVKADAIAKKLTEKNILRQELTAAAILEAKAMIYEKGDKKIHIVYSKDWIPGIIGLIAGRICEEYGKPAIAISIGQNHAKGSARSISGINIVEVIRNCSDILIDVGGHKGAAGFSLAIEQIEEFERKMENLMESLPDNIEPLLEIEAIAQKNHLTKKLAEQIDLFSPFGMENPQPILVTYKMKVSDLRRLSEGKHLKFKAEGINAIAFGMGAWADLLTEGDLVDLAYTLEINRFNGQEHLQLKVKDIKIS